MRDNRRTRQADIPRILVGHWRESTEPDPDQHAVYGILSRDDKLRFKVVAETRDGRHITGHCPSQGDSWIVHQEVVLEPHLRHLNRLEMKHYCRVRRTQMDDGEEEEDLEANMIKAAELAREHCATVSSRERPRNLRWARETGADRQRALRKQKRAAMLLEQMRTSGGGPLPTQTTASSAAGGPAVAAGSGVGSSGSASGSNAQPAPNRPTLPPMQLHPPTTLPPLPPPPQHSSSQNKSLSSAPSHHVSRHDTGRQLAPKAENGYITTPYLPPRRSTSTRDMGTQTLVSGDLYAPRVKPRASRGDSSESPNSKTGPYSPGSPGGARDHNSPQGSETGSDGRSMLPTRRLLPSRRDFGRPNPDSP